MSIAGKHWAVFILMNLAFMIGIGFILVMSYIAEIKRNWPLYRCNPIFMPLSDDMQKDFTYCVQTSQQNMMGYYLAPFSYILSAFADLGNSFSNSLNDVRYMLNNIRGYFSGLVVNLFGVFFNLIIEFQKMIIGIRDMMGKFNAVLVVLMYIIDGSIMMLQSVWNGTPGKLTRKIGNCFHPDTLVKMENGNVLCMKDVPTGARLKGGVQVRAVMQIHNDGKENLYVYPGQGENQSDLYVTSSHYVLSGLQFIPVEHDKRAKPTVHFHEPPTFCCLITDTHRIPLGELTFWDWEDFLLSHQFIPTSS